VELYCQYRKILGVYTQTKKHIYEYICHFFITNLMHKLLIYLHIIHLLKSSTYFEHYPAHLQEVYVVILYMQSLVSSLCAGDCPVHRLRRNEIGDKKGNILWCTAKQSSRYIYIYIYICVCVCVCVCVCQYKKLRYNQKYFFINISVTTDETHNLHTLFCQQDAESKFVISISCLQSFQSEMPNASRSTNTMLVVHKLQNLSVR